MENEDGSVTSLPEHLVLCISRRAPITQWIGKQKSYRYGWKRCYTKVRCNSRLNETGLLGVYRFDRPSRKQRHAKGAMIFRRWLKD